MSNDVPLITIGLTCYNAAETMRRALLSALSQDWPNFEVVIVDDSSDDTSVSVVSPLARKDGRVRLVRHSSNLGCAAARNTVVANARGDFLAFFDDDDHSRSDRLSLQHSAIVAYEQQTGAHIVACYCSGQRIYPNGYTMNIQAVGAYGDPPVGIAMADYLLFNRKRRNVFYGGGAPTCSMMARIGVFKETGDFDTTMRRQEDADFAIRLGFMDGHFIGIPEPVLTQYATGGGEKDPKVEFQCTRVMLKKYREYLEANGRYQYMLYWSELRYLHFCGRICSAASLLAGMLLRYPIRTTVHFCSSAVRRFVHEQRIR